MDLRHIIMVSGNSKNNKFLLFIVKFILSLIKFIFIWLIITVIISYIIFECNNHFDDYCTLINLGDNFEISTHPYGLVYRMDSRTCEMIIPSGIKAVNSNERWIVVITEGLNATYNNDSTKSPDGLQYWILDKNATKSYRDTDTLLTTYGTYVFDTKRLQGPYDSISFYQKLENLNIKLIPDIIIRKTE